MQRQAGNVTGGKSTSTLCPSPNYSHAYSQTERPWKSRLF